MAVQATALEPMITAKEAAARLRCSMDALIDLAETGKVPAMKIGGKWRFLGYLLDAWARGVKPKLLPYVEPPAPEDPETFPNIYIIRGGPYYKIGIAQDLKARLAAFGTHCPHKCSVVFSLRSAIARGIEGDIHDDLAQYRVHGEWFKLTKCQLAAAIESIKRKATIR